MKYNLLAYKYDLLTYDVDYQKMIEFYNYIIEKQNVNVRNVLELGCGTGNITEKLIGYNIFAIDISEEMLSVAMEKFQGKRNISLFNMDIREFKFGKKFDLCIAGLDVINYIYNEEDLIKTFKNVYDHLEKDSVFIFDINSSYKIKHYIGNNIFTDEVDDVVYIWQGSYDENSSINEYLLTFFVKDIDGKYERFSEVHKERAYDETFIVDLLKEAGFSKIETYDEFTREPAKKESLRISFVAYKKGV